MLDLPQLPRHVPGNGNAEQAQPTRQQPPQRIAKLSLLLFPCHICLHAFKCLNAQGGAPRVGKRLAKYPPAKLLRNPKQCHVADALLGVGVHAASRPAVKVWGAPKQQPF